jgi:hypothetical protein
VISSTTEADFTAVVVQFLNRALINGNNSNSSNAFAINYKKFHTRSVSSEKRMSPR